MKVLVISRRLLLAHGIKSLLEETPGISSVEVMESYYATLRYPEQEPPDTVVIDLPAGAPFFVDRPLRVKGREVKTIVLQEESGQTRLYTHEPAREASLQTLLSSLLEQESAAPAPALDFGHGLDSVVRAKRKT